MRESSRVFVNTATNWGTTCIKGLVGFLLVPFLLTRLGKEGYGLASLSQVVVSFTMLADLGIRGALSRQLSEYAVRKDTRKFNECCSSGFAFYLAAGLVAMMACIILAPWLVKLFKVSPELESQGIFLVRYYGGVSAFLAFVTPVYAAVLSSKNRFDLVNMRDSVISISQGLLMFAVLGMTSWGLYGWAVVQLAGQSLSLALLWQAARKIMPEMHIRPQHMRLGMVRELMAFGGVLFAMQTANMIGLQANPLILGAMLGPIAVAIYNPGASLVSMARPLISALSNQLNPLATEYHVNGQQQQMQQLLLRGTRYTILMCIPVCVTLMAFCEPISRIWLQASLGESYLPAAYILFSWALLDLLTYSAGTQWAVATGTRRLKFYAWIMVPPSIVAVVLSTVLVKYTALGVMGVMIPMILVKVFQRPLCMAYACRLCGLSLKRYVKESYVRPAWVLLGVGTAAGALLWLGFGANLVLLIAAAGIVAVFSALLTWIVGFTREDRMSFKGLLSRAIEQVRKRPEVSAPHQSAQQPLAVQPKDDTLRMESHAGQVVAKEMPLTPDADERGPA